MPELLSLLRRHRLLAILRGVPTTHVPRLIEELRGAGSELFEVAPSDAHGLEALRAARDLPLAAGAEAVGAASLVTPHVVSEVARERGPGLLMGALTPTEMALALTLGSAGIKVFPAGPSAWTTSASCTVPTPTR